jgi:hypothetical protein
VLYTAADFKDFTAPKQYSTALSLLSTHKKTQKKTGLPQNNEYQND